MRDSSIARRRAATAAGAVLVMLAAASPGAATSDTAAHDIAERFAREAAKGEAKTRQRRDDEKRKADESSRQATDDRRKTEEAEMLARARAEAEQRRLEMLRAREEAERTDQARRAEEERRLAEAEARRKAEAEAAEAAMKAEAARKAEEERRLAEIRAEEEARAEAALRQAEMVRKAEEEHRLVEQARRRAEAEARIAEEERQAEAARQAEELRLRAQAEHKADEDRRTAERVRLEAEREAEAERLAERLRTAREARSVQTSGNGVVARQGPIVTGSGEHQSMPGEGRWGDPPEPARHVTVLLLMQPGDRGIRRNHKTADPVLCGPYACYVSNGPDRVASLLPAQKALGFFRTWGRRAGACNNSLGCVFRGVDIEALSGIVRPVDMRVVRHDRREAQEIEFASRCEIDRGRLTCSDALYAEDYVMWLVPERMAAAAGPAALVQALDEGLPDTERTASAPPWPAR